MPGSEVAIQRHAHDCAIYGSGKARAHEHPEGDGEPGGQSTRKHAHSVIRPDHEAPVAEKGVPACPRLPHLELRLRGQALGHALVHRQKAGASFGAPELRSCSHSRVFTPPSLVEAAEAHNFAGVGGGRPDLAEGRGVGSGMASINLGLPTEVARGPVGPTDRPFDAH
eukprot:scaffold2940_cov128-Isochrysis_galbana.AAC.2